MDYRVSEGNSVEGERVEWTASPPLKRDPASKGSGQMSGPTRDKQVIEKPHRAAIKGTGAASTLFNDDN